MGARDVMTYLSHRFTVAVLQYLLSVYLIYHVRGLIGGDHVTDDLPRR